jgi:hypothetical protein
MKMILHYAARSEMYMQDMIESKRLLVKSSRSPTLVNAPDNPHVNPNPGILNEEAASNIACKHSCISAMGLFNMAAPAPPPGDYAAIPVDMDP